ncbi:MAG: Bro-N domain-containing protein [Betaproteobacteria bacterium]|nr:Bro-N domain-containing protein [Betaproteobacteria bacterium]
MSKKSTIPVVHAEDRIVIFQEKSVRRAWHKNEWWFSVQDVVAVLTDSPNPTDYIKKMRLRDKELSQGWGQLVTPLRLETGGGMQSGNCANTEGIFRIIQSIPSPKAEPFKLWLAQVGYERVKEIEDPELASTRARELYEAKGYPKDWVEKRMRAIAIRGALTDEWKARGVAEGREYSILTAEIARATFGVTPGAHKKIKGLDQVKPGNNLRDHMTDLELIFTMLGEAGTTEIARRKNAQGFAGNRSAAKEGGAVAGNARKELEAKTGVPVISRQNYLSPPETTQVATTENSSVVQTEGNKISDTATVSKIETVRGRTRNPKANRKPLAEKPAGKGRGKKK